MLLRPRSRYAHHRTGTPGRLVIRQMALVLPHGTRRAFIRYLPWLVCLCLSARVQAAPARCLPLDVRMLQSLVLDARRALVEFDGKEAAVLINHALEQIPCLTGVPSPQLLALAWFELGMARRLQGDVDGARQAFARALVHHPQLPWNFQFGDIGRREFDEAFQAQIERGSIRLRLPRLRLEAALFLDGAQLAARQRSVRTTDGPHLLQVVVRGRVVYNTYLSGGSPVGTPP